MSVTESDFYKKLQQTNDSYANIFRSYEDVLTTQRRVLGTAVAGGRNCTIFDSLGLGLEHLGLFNNSNNETTNLGLLSQPLSSLYNPLTTNPMLYHGITINNVGPSPSSSSTSTLPSTAQRAAAAAAMMTKCDSILATNTRQMSPFQKKQPPAKNNYAAAAALEGQSKTCHPPQGSITDSVVKKYHAIIHNKSNDNNKEGPARRPVANDEPTVKLTFPRVLCTMLEDKRNEGIIEWLPDGRQFSILDKHTFASEVLPRHFSQCKFSSFTRKLNRWGFKFDQDMGTYSHIHFQRDAPRLMQQMFTYEGKVRRMAQSKATFPKVLQDVLADKASKGIIEWLPDGKRFMLIDPRRFEFCILHKYFGRCKFASFGRKLNRWGFTFDRDGGTYSHPCFLRDFPEKAKMMFAQEGKIRQEQKRLHVEPLPQHYLDAAAAAAAASSGDVVEQQLMMN